MLRSPYTRYEHLYVYYLDTVKIPPVDHPDLIGVWIEDNSAILFFHTPQEKLIADICSATGAQLIYQADLDYHDWEAGVKIGPFCTKSLAIRPIWDEPADGAEGRQEITLDPSVIFGSGFHPTTRLCLETLELLMLESGQEIRTVADLGTGTGLLAIAAAKLGAENITALDNNPLACKVAQKNVQLNGCEEKVKVREHDLLASTLETSSFDLVIANLYKTLLVKLFNNPGFWKAKMYIISGIIPAMEGEILSALPQEGLRFLHRANSGIWRLWVLGCNLRENN